VATGPHSAAELEGADVVVADAPAIEPALEALGMFR
jgi:hypothetical protein